MRLVACLLSTALLLFFVRAVSADDRRQPTKTDDIKLLRIKAADIEKIIAAHKGKVVVVDVWAEF
jgi:hypothetical protein